MSKRDKDDQEPNRPPKHLPKMNKRKLDRFLASICEAAGMTGGTHEHKAPEREDGAMKCQGPCAKADWRAHLDIPAGILCVSAAWSTNKHAEKHRDVTVSLTYRDPDGKTQHNEMIFCDSEVRWLMETIWHAPIWE